GGVRTFGIGLTVLAVTPHHRDHGVGLPVDPRGEEGAGVPHAGLVAVAAADRAGGVGEGGQAGVPQPQRGGRVHARTPSTRCVARSPSVPASAAAGAVPQRWWSPARRHPWWWGSPREREVPMRRWWGREPVVRSRRVWSRGQR